MKRALLVGINTYPGCPLRGCVNDVLLMYKILTEKMGFTQSMIKVVLDKNATKKGIMDGLQWLTRDTKPGDQLFFHYSGHGSQVVSKDWTISAETDGRDEIICPVNMDFNDPFRDQTLGQYFKGLDPGVKSTVVLDCCHSGTGLRNTWKTPIPFTEDDWVNRFMPPPPENILENPEIKLDDDLNFLVLTHSDDAVQTQKRAFVNPVLTGQGNTILISGCRDDQTSADAYIGGRYQGALTFLLAQTLMETQFRITYQTLVAQVNQKMKTQKFTQEPQLECNPNQFGINFMA